MSFKELSQQEREFLISSIRNVPNFPKPGIIFKDITTLLNNKKAFNLLMDHLTQRYRDYNLDYIAGIESRGFIFGAALAAKLNIGFVPIRKKGKLPYTTVSEKYTLEYGVDAVEIHIDAFNGKKDAKVLLIDDLLATGGTASAAANLIQKVGAKCVEACFIIELSFLNGKDKLNVPIFSVIKEG